MRIYIICFLFPLFFYDNYVHPWWFDIVPIHEFLQTDGAAHISYKKCFETTEFCFKKHPFYMGDDAHPYQGSFDETFVLTIPQGRCHGHYGYVLLNNCFIKEMIWKNLDCHLQSVDKIDEKNVCKISGKVAVLGQLAFFQYYHWISEVLCRLAMLEMHHVSYDKVYVAQSSHFMKEMLQLWGIKKEQIIEPYGFSYCIQADELIVPSLVSNVNFGLKWFSCYPRKDLLSYVRNKLLNAALLAYDGQQFSKKIFISRKDAPSRKIINEDELFAMLQKHGFERYELNKMSVTDQILLFNQADLVIGAQGTSLANSMFCKPGTKIIEVFQKLNDTTIYFLSQIFDLDYTAIKTMEFEMNYGAAFVDTEISLDIINFFL